MAAVTSQATNSQDNPLVGFGTNEWIVEEMYQRYLADPASVDPAWHDFFTDYRPALSSLEGTTVAPAAPAPEKAAPAPQAAAVAAAPAPAPAKPEAKATPAGFATTPIRGVAAKIVSN